VKDLEGGWLFVIKVDNIFRTRNTKRTLEIIVDSYRGIIGLEIVTSAYVSCSFRTSQK
jgi:hypothetical protein